MYILYTAFFSTVKEFVQNVVEGVQYALARLPALPLLPLRLARKPFAWVRAVRRRRRKGAEEKGGGKAKAKEI